VVELVVLRAGRQFGQRAEAWWIRHEGEPRYLGARNLEARLPMSAREFPDEWIDR
jgi:hypothetical protein